jgi:hypothetical protein
MAQTQKKAAEAPTVADSLKMSLDVVKAKGKAIAKPVVKAPDKVAEKAPVRRVAKYADTDVIRLTEVGAKGNPKRGGAVAYRMYELYQKGAKGMTVREYVDAVGTTERSKAGRAAIAWDLARGYITVAPAGK